MQEIACIGCMNPFIEREDNTPLIYCDETPTTNQNAEKQKNINAPKNKKTKKYNLSSLMSCYFSPFVVLR